MTYATSGWSFSTRGNIWYQIPFYLLDRISDLADNLPDIFTFFLLYLYTYSIDCYSFVGSHIRVVLFLFLSFSFLYFSFLPTFG